jgi:uncharacterized membrane protein
MKTVAKSGAVLAAAALSLAVTGVAFTAGPAAAAEKVQCVGVNSCKGQGACKQATHSCKGQNACKGQAWISTTAAQCKAWGGTIQS